MISIWKLLVAHSEDFRSPPLCSAWLWLANLLVDRNVEWNIRSCVFGHGHKCWKAHGAQRRNLQSGVPYAADWTRPPINVIEHSSVATLRVGPWFPDFRPHVLKSSSEPDPTSWLILSSSCRGVCFRLKYDLLREKRYQFLTLRDSVRSFCRRFRSVCADAFFFTSYTRGYDAAEKLGTACRTVWKGLCVRGRMRGERSYGIGGEPVFLEFFSYRISGSVRYTFLRIALNLRVFLHSFFSQSWPRSF